MTIQVCSRGFALTEGLRAYGERRLAFALGRFQGRVRSVRLAFDDLNGPRGGVDKRVQVVVRLTGTREVRIEQSDRDLYAAIDRAGDRVHRAVSRELARRRIARFVPASVASKEEAL